MVREEIGFEADFESQGTYGFGFMVDVVGQGNLMGLE
jgi:hypothetical protein